VLAAAVVWWWWPTTTKLQQLLVATLIYLYDELFSLRPSFVPPPVAPNLAGAIITMGATVNFLLLYKNCPKVPQINQIT